MAASEFRLYIAASLDGFTATPGFIATPDGIVRLSYAT